MKNIFQNILIALFLFFSFKSSCQQTVVLHEGYLTAIGNQSYNGWIRVAKSNISQGYGGLRGGVKITLTAMGGNLGPSMQIICAYKDWHSLGLIGSVQDFIGYNYFSKFRLVTDSDFAYIEAFANNISIPYSSSFHVLVESLGYVQNNWMAYYENLTPGLMNPTTVSELGKINNGLSLANLSISGNVGVGTYEPTEKLSVNGNIKAKKLIVSQSNWPDFVFNNDYNLLPISALEEFIFKNKHLPDIPLENEISKNGLDLGSMQALLLKKIEELTLYLIKQNKKLFEQEQSIKILQCEIQNMRLKIN